MNQNDLRKIIKEEILLLIEGSLAKGVDVSLNELIKNIKSGKGVDKRAIKNMTDGELLATFLTPVFQSALNTLEDRKGFVRNFRI